MISNIKKTKFDTPEAEKKAAEELRKKLLTLNNPPSSTTKKWYDKVADKLMWIFIIVWNTLTTRGVF